jgi:hypothetical protein
VDLVPPAGAESEGRFAGPGPSAIVFILQFYVGRIGANGERMHFRIGFANVCKSFSPTLMADAPNPRSDPLMTVIDHA